RTVTRDPRVEEGAASRANGIAHRLQDARDRAPGLVELADPELHVHRVFAIVVVDVADDPRLIPLGRAGTPLDAKEAVGQRRTDGRLGGDARLSLTRGPSRRRQGLGFVVTSNSARTHRRREPAAIDAHIPSPATDDDDTGAHVGEDAAHVLTACG